MKRLALILMGIVVPLCALLIAGALALGRLRPASDLTYGFNDMGAQACTWVYDAPARRWHMIACIRQTIPIPR